MRFVEFVIKSKDVRLIDIVPLLQQIYVNAHVWNVDDTVPEVFESKRKHVIHNLLEFNISNKAIKGKLEYDYCYDNYGERIEDQVTGEYPTYVQLDRSVVNIKSLVEFLIADLKDDLNLIPDELLAVAGIEKTKINKELSELRLQKDNLDSLIEAAKKICMQFFESDLGEKPTKEAFIKVFVALMGQGIPENTIEKIYNTLIFGYRPHEEGETDHQDKANPIIKYAFEAGAFCSVNAKDDYIPIFEDVVNYMATLHGKGKVTDSLLKEILSYADASMIKKDGRPRKVLVDAIKAGFYMRGWYDDDNKISESIFNTNFKRDLSNTAVHVRSKAWEQLNKFRA